MLGVLLVLSMVFFNTIFMIFGVILFVTSLMLKELLYNLAETILDKKQKSYLCPRCNIAVDTKTKICEKCGKEV